VGIDESNDALILLRTQTVLLDEKLKLVPHSEKFIRQTKDPAVKSRNSRAVHEVRSGGVAGHITHSGFFA